MEQDPRECRGWSFSIRPLAAGSRGRHPFDIAIVDVHMPEMSGLELCRLIKGDPTSAKTHVILLTASGQRGDSMLAKEVGAAAYLIKPICERHLALS